MSENHKLRGDDFFSRNLTERQEIIADLFREGQIIVNAGPFGVGKSPLQADLTVCVVHGIPWCDRAVQRRPVAVFDFENSGPTYKRNIQAIADRYGVPVPQVPEELEVYLEHDSADEPATAKLLHALQSAMAFELLEDALQRKPNALVIIDPAELLFRIDTREKKDVLRLYSKLRLLLAKFPRAAIWLTFNMRKRDRRTGMPSLLTAPRDWLEEVCGTLDISNRSDVRLGMDFQGEEWRVINGFRRGEEMDPMLIRSVGDPDSGLAGFELMPPDEVTLRLALRGKQLTHWERLPDEFRFDEIADKLVPRVSLSRLLKRAKSLGVVKEAGAVWRKRRVRGS